MTEKNEARVRTRAPMVPIGAKTLLSLLMAVVMLVGLLPVTVLAAPTTGSGSKDDPYIVKTYADLKEKLQSTGTTYIKVTRMDHKTPISLADGSTVLVRELKVGKDFENLSAAISIPEGAHKYLEIATDLWFIGDGQNGVSGYPEAILGRLIDLNAGASLTITGNRTLRVDFNTLTARNAIIVNWGGNLTIDGDVTLDARQEMYTNIHGTALNLQAGTTNIYGGTFWGSNYYTKTTSGGGGVIFVDDSPAAPKLNIFGGTFKPVNAGTDTGWMYALDCHNENAKISLAGGTFESGIRSIGNISELLAQDSKFFKDDAVFAGAVKDTKDTLSVQRAATLKDLTLNVGSTSHGASDTTFDYVVGSDNKLSVNFNAGPEWFTTDYKDGRINLNAALVAWENGTLKTSVRFTPVADYKSDGSVDITLNVSGLDLQIGKTYTIYAYINPYMGDTKLADSHSVAQWTIKAVEKPISQVLSGSIVYTSGVRYGADVTTARMGDVKDIASDKLHYQWQVKSGDAWTDISGATAGKLDASKVNTVVGKDIRLKITADGYEGVLYSPVKTVAKAAQTAIPDTPELDCRLSAEEGGGALVQLTNKKDNQEYLLSSSSKTDEELAASNGWRDTINNGCGKGLTFYIYTRMKETDTHAAGTIYRYTTVSTADVVELKNLALAGYTQNIYVKKGEPLTIDVVGTPANANKWNTVYFIEEDTTAHNLTVTADNDSTNYIPAGTGSSTTFGNHTITITSDKVGSHKMVAFPADTYNPHATPFGTWNVVVYEPGNITNFDIIDPPAYADVILAVGESYAPELTNPTLTTKPDDAMTGHTLKWFVKTPATATGVPTYNDNNGYISVDENGKVTALAVNGTVDDDYKVVALHVVDGAGHFVKSVASYNVTVNPAMAPALESISVHPGAVTMKAGENVTLTAVKNPVNAEGMMTWSSSNTAVATVDSTGKVTAADVGTATITVTCGTKTATCTVKVVCTTHTPDTWTKLDDTNHYRTCTTCGEGMEIEEHTFGDWQQGDATRHYKECSVCGHKVYANHEESARITDTAAGIGTAGAWHTKCEVCGKTMNSGTIAALEKIDKAEVTVTAPVRNAAPTNAAVKDTETRYYVADTEWTPDVTDKFASGTKYTVKVTLEANNGYAFKGDGIFGIGDTTFYINGSKARVVSGDAQQVVITYEFPSTGSGSYSGGTGSGGTTTNKPVKSARTGDPGVMLYAAMGLLSLTGGAWVVGKKRKDK